MSCYLNFILKEDSIMRERGNGTGSVTKIENRKGQPRYRVRVTVKTYFDEVTMKTKIVSKSLGVYKTKTEAEAVLAEYNRCPLDLESKVETVEDLYNEWSKGYFEKLKGDSSVRTITSAWKYCTGIYNMPLKKLNTGHIRDIMDSGFVIVETGKDKGSKRYASICTKARIKSIFNLMLDYAYERNLVVKNVARAFDINDIRKEIDYQKKIKLPFTDKEVELLWENIDEFPFVDVLLIGIYTGFRPQELCLLKIENIDLDGNCIIGGMKSRAGTNRKVPIHPLIKNLVEKRYNQALSYNSQWLFNDRFSQTGLHLTYDKLRHRFETIMAELGINNRTGHCLRVTFSTKAYASGIPEYIVKRIVGHSLKSNVTDAVYNYVEFDRLYEEICKITK